MYDTSDLLTAIFVAVVIAFSVGFSFIGMSMCIRFGVVHMLDGCSKIVDKLKNSNKQ